MLIAREKRTTNVAEYILYMWQIEDLLRACSFDQELIRKSLMGQFVEVKNITEEIFNWYVGLAKAMQLEKIEVKGHLQVLINLVNDLNEFHLRLVKTKIDRNYFKLYLKNKPDINEFNQKMSISNLNDVEICLNASYGFMLLKLKNTEISKLTYQSIQGFSQLIGHLSARYIQFEIDEFEF